MELTKEILDSLDFKVSYRGFKGKVLSLTPNVSIIKTNNRVLNTNFHSIPQSFESKEFILKPLYTELRHDEPLQDYHKDYLFRYMADDFRKRYPGLSKKESLELLLKGYKKNEQ